MRIYSSSIKMIKCELITYIPMWLSTTRCIKLPLNPFCIMSQHFSLYRTRYSHLGCCITLSRTSLAKYTGPKFSVIMSLKTTCNDQNKKHHPNSTEKNALSINQPSPWTVHTLPTLPLDSTSKVPIYIYSLSFVIQIYLFSITKEKKIFLQRQQVLKHIPTWINAENERLNAIGAIDSRYRKIIKIFLLSFFAAGWG